MWLAVLEYIQDVKSCNMRCQHTSETFLCQVNCYLLQSVKIHDGVFPQTAGLQVIQPYILLAILYLDMFRPTMGIKASVVPEIQNNLKWSTVDKETI